MTGYGRRNHAETTMNRYKHLIGSMLRARNRTGQGGEVALAIQVLNRIPHRQAHVRPPMISAGQKPCRPCSAPCTKAAVPIHSVVSTDS